MAEAAVCHIEIEFGHFKILISLSWGEPDLSNASVVWCVVNIPHSSLSPAGASHGSLATQDILLHLCTR